MVEFLNSALVSSSSYVLNRRFDITNILNMSQGKTDDNAPGLDSLSALIATIRSWAIIACIVAIIIAALTWAWGSLGSNQQTATQGKKGVIVAVAAAAIIFAAEPLVKWGADLGNISLT